MEKKLGFSKEKSFWFWTFIGRLKNAPVLVFGSPFGKQCYIVDERGVSAVHNTTHILI